MKMPSFNRITFFCAAFALFATCSLAQDAATGSSHIGAGQAQAAPTLAIIAAREGDRPQRGPRGSQGGSTGLDLFESLYIRGELDDYRPVPGETVPGSESLHWESAAFDETGNLAEQAPYIYVPVYSETERVMLLHAVGHGAAYINGEPRVGNVYATNYVYLPVALREGLNTFFFKQGRRNLQLTFDAPPDAVSLQDSDITLPDLPLGAAADTWGAVIVHNTGREFARDYVLRLSGPGLVPIESAVPAIAPVASRKAPFRILAPAPREAGDIAATLELASVSGETLHRIDLRLKTVDTASGQSYSRTFISDIDGSVQYYGYRPAIAPAGGALPALILSCHGASVEARGQARSYSTKTWAQIVAPTNRRPFGFDWEDFGREDAMEVLALAERELPYDPSRVYVTGHSMGGHGAWHLAATYPGIFAAAGPSAGWISRASYGGSRGESGLPNVFGEFLSRGDIAGDTLALASNLANMAVYIVHGADDDNVPVAQARKMAEVLGEFHHDWQYHEEPGKKHWWNNDYGDGGAACVDYPLMMDAFARHALPPAGAVRHVSFATANPGVSSRCYWAGIDAQETQGLVSKVDLTVWPNKGRLEGTTENVALLRIDTAPFLGLGPIAVLLDGQTLEDIALPEAGGPSSAEALYFAREDGTWRAAEKAPLIFKGPHRHGPLNVELKHRFLFVYGTAGGAEENAWAFTRARYDAATFWYRGNGAVEMLPDTEFDAKNYPDRTVLLYGNADTNAAWAGLLGESPVQVRRGEAALGGRGLGGGTAALFVRPRADSFVASVIAVSGTDIAGMRATDHYPLFIPGRHYPDCLVSRISGKDTPELGIMAAGYFGNDWTLEAGEFVCAEDWPVTGARK